MFRAPMKRDVNWMGLAVVALALAALVIAVGRTNPGGAFDKPDAG